METTRERISRIYRRGAMYYDKFCRAIDALTDSEFEALCECFDEYTTDASILDSVTDLERLAELLGVEPSELEERIY